MACVVTKLQRVGGRARLVWVYINDNRVGRLTQEQAQRLGLGRGRELQPQELEEVMRSCERLEARLAATRWLARRPRSRAELARYLKTKGFAAATVEAVLEELQRLGHLSDEQYARTLAEELVRRGRGGPAALRAKLRQRGIAAPLAEQAVAEVMEGVDERELARQIARKRLPVVAQLPLPVARRRLYAFLARRGFSPETIASVVSELLPAED
jgi:regulatory protein